MAAIANAIEEYITIQIQIDAVFIGTAVTQPYRQIDRQLRDSIRCTSCDTAQLNRISEARPSH